MQTDTAHAAHILIKAVVYSIHIGISQVIRSFGFLTLDELDVGLFDDVKLDGIIIIAWLIPAYLTEILLQILLLKTVAVIGQDLIAQQAQFLL